MAEILSFLTAGAFVYLALKIRLVGGDVWYYLLALIALAIGYAISR